MTFLNIKSQAISLRVHNIYLTSLVSLQLMDSTVAYNVSTVRRLRFSSDADNVRLTNVCIIIIIIISIQQHVTRTCSHLSVTGNV